MELREKSSSTCCDARSRHLVASRLLGQHPLRRAMGNPSSDEPRRSLGGPSTLQTSELITSNNLEVGFILK